MKKSILFFTFLALALVLTGCGKENQSQEQVQNKDITKESNKSAISSIKDAMGLGKTMKCTYKVKTGDEDVEMVVYVKGEKYRSENSFQEKKMIGIFDGETIYTWNEGEKNGLKMAKKCTEDLAEMNQGMNEEGEMNQEDEPQNMEQNFDNAMDINCEEVGNIDLSVPSDVEFVDQCEMMKNSMDQMQDMMKQYQVQMPN